jgi:alkylhydroperoxidase family enzyme
VGDADVEALHRVGFSADDIWDIASITAFFSMSNRLSHAMALAPNPEFHLMGRVPREPAG